MSGDDTIDEEEHRNRRRRLDDRQTPGWVGVVLSVLSICLPLSAAAGAAYNDMSSDLAVARAELVAHGNAANHRIDGLEKALLEAQRTAHDALGAAAKVSERTARSEEQYKGLRSALDKLAAEVSRGFRRIERKLD